MSRTVTAYHEAGHAVLSAAINDAPRHVSIRPNAKTLGRSRARLVAGPASIAQVYVAGFAAEHLLTGRRSRQLEQEVGFALATRRHPSLRKAFAGSEEQDGYRVVVEIVRMGLASTEGEIRREVDRFYGVAWRSLAAVWRPVQRVAAALLAQGELDRAGVREALGSEDIRGAVLKVQRAYGFEKGRAGAGRASAAPPPDEGVGGVGGAFAGPSSSTMA